jgi:hypothetical protein
MVGLDGGCSGGLSCFFVEAFGDDVLADFCGFLQALNLNVESLDVGVFRFELQLDTLNHFFEDLNLSFHFNTTTRCFCYLVLEVLSVILFEL